jgi:hypothetical protein
MITIIGFLCNKLLWYLANEAFEILCWLCYDNNSINDDHKYFNIIYTLRIVKEVDFFIFIFLFLSDANKLKDLVI